MNITKNGVIAYPNIYESKGCDVLENSYKYTNENPFVLNLPNLEIAPSFFL